MEKNLTTLELQLERRGISKYKLCKLLEVSDGEMPRISRAIGGGSPVTREELTLWIDTINQEMREREERFDLPSMEPLRVEDLALRETKLYIE